MWIPGGSSRPPAIGLASIFVRLFVSPGAGIATASALIAHSEGGQGNFRH
jgi:hypothetical protein